MGKVFPNGFFPLFSVWSRSFRSGCFLPVMVVVFFREGVWYDWNRGFLWLRSASVLPEPVPLMTICLWRGDEDDDDGRRQT